jgi:hypothetical protein
MSVIIPSENRSLTEVAHFAVGKEFFETEMAEDVRSEVKQQSNDGGRQL